MSLLMPLAWVLLGALMVALFTVTVAASEMRQERDEARAALARRPHSQRRSTRVGCVRNVKSADKRASTHLS